MKTVSVILPTYNEAGNIVALIISLRKHVSGLKEILVIDDNSRDKTAQIAQQWIKRHHATHSIRVIIRHSEHGLTNSISEGIREAKGEIIVWMDADFSHPPPVINSLTSAIRSGADIAVASRYIAGGQSKSSGFKTESKIAIRTSFHANTLLRRVFAVPFTDFTSGFVAVKKRIIQTIPLRGSYGEYFIDFIVRAFARKLSVIETPYLSVPRRSGTSKTAPTIFHLFKRFFQYGTMVTVLLWETKILKKYR